MAVQTEEPVAVEPAVAEREAQEPCWVITINMTGVDAPYIHGGINGAYCDLTLDTGCTTTLVSKRLYDHLPQQPALWQEGVMVKMGDGTPVTVYGVTEVHFQLGPKVIYRQVIVVDITDEVLMGMDFVKQEGMVLDFDVDEVRVKGLRFPILDRQRDREVKPRACRVIVERSVVIEAGSRVLIEGKAAQPVAQGVHMVMPLSKAIGGQPLLVAKSVVRGGTKHVPLEVMNLTEQDITLHGNTHAALLTPVREDEEVVDLQP